MPLTARLMSRGMSEPPAVTTRSRGALNTGEGGLCSGWREEACASGGAASASAIADFIGATKRKTHQGRRKKIIAVLLPPHPRQPVENLRAHPQGGVRVMATSILGSGPRILLPSARNSATTIKRSKLKGFFPSMYERYSETLDISYLDRTACLPQKLPSPCTSIAWHVSLVGQLLGLPARSLDGWIMDVKGKGGNAATALALLWYERLFFLSCNSPVAELQRRQFEEWQPKAKARFGSSLQLASIAYHGVQRSCKTACSPRGRRQCIT